ncbi:ABC transporter substrate-binding protein [Micromonospora krabiensis]|uniref:Oligopeptide transport system substrate-binding protein n=1 Tax=Micromonospora krabiensis TaxID=307121 RepID=A0A1C3NAZ3_9ACTN|nr:ABC transporter substrate-binding protein [Micromonospora krabiensis]SBV29693.1 oligopeptide transport system substrate-binding protein [Micromonospora krabiensis]
MRVRRLAAWTALPLAVTLGLAACGSGGDGGSGSDSKAVSIWIGEPKHLVPTNTTETNGDQVLQGLFSPLVTFDAQSKPVMNAAESITSPDNKVWTIKLKDGYTFHNGEKVTSDNYINAWNYGAYAPNGQDANYFFEKIAGYADLQGDAPKAKTLSGLKKVDDLTFQVTLTDPFIDFRSMLNYDAFFPMPEAAFSAPGVLKDSYEAAPIGQGPFKMKGTWQHDSKIEVERYDAFPGEKPKVQAVEFRIYQQLSAAYADLQADNLDVLTTIPAENLSTAQADLGDRYQTSPMSGIQYLAFPTFDKDYANPDVRKAISMAINRDEITKSIFKDTQQPAHSFVSPILPGFRENGGGAATEYNPTEAKKLYEAAGGPKKITISYNGDGGHKDWVDATVNQLKANLGVDAVGVAEPKFADLLTKVEKKQPVGTFRMGWIMDYPSMEDYLGPLFSTNGSSNYYGYSNPEFDKLVKVGAAAPTEDEAIKKFQQAEDILAKDMPVIPLRYQENVFGHSSKVKNVEVDAYQRVNLTKIELAD